MFTSLKLIMAVDSNTLKMTFTRIGDDKPEYDIFLDLHSRQCDTPTSPLHRHLIDKILEAQQKELIAQGHRASK